MSRTMPTMEPTTKFVPAINLNACTTKGGGTSSVWVDVNTTSLATSASLISIVFHLSSQHLSVAGISDGSPCITVLARIGSPQLHGSAHVASAHDRYPLCGDPRDLVTIAA